MGGNAAAGRAARRPGAARLASRACRARRATAGDRGRRGEPVRPRARSSAWRVSAATVSRSSPTRWWASRPSSMARSASRAWTSPRPGSGAGAGWACATSLRSGRAGAGRRPVGRRQPRPFRRSAPAGMGAWLGAQRRAARRDHGDREFAIAGATPGREARLLGGNAQKLVLARELHGGAPCWSPTRRPAGSTSRPAPSCTRCWPRRGARGRDPADQRGPGGGAGAVGPGPGDEPGPDRRRARRRSPRAEIGALMLGHA